MRYRQHTRKQTADNEIKAEIDDDRDEIFAYKSFAGVTRSRDGAWRALVTYHWVMCGLRIYTGWRWSAATFCVPGLWTNLFPEILLYIDIFWTDPGIQIFQSVILTVTCQAHVLRMFALGPTTSTSCIAGCKLVTNWKYTKMELTASA